MQSSDSDLPQIEYEDIVSGEGTLNKDLRDKEGGKTGIKFYAGDVLYGKLRPYLMNWLYPQFNGVAVGDFWVLRATECDSSFLYRLVQTDSFQRLANVSSGSKMPRADWNLISQSFLAVPVDYAEQRAIAKSLAELDNLIALHQCKCQYRSLYGYLSWEQRKFGELYRPVSEKNDLSFGRDRAISVANMYFNPAVYVTEDSYLATYNVMRLGDIAFEGNRSKRFAHGRFVENTIGDGIVSHVFKVFRHIGDNYDLSYWKYAINNEKLMRDVLTRSTKASTMMHELVTADFLEESTLVPSLNEQRAIGAAIDSIDRLITLHQR